MVEGCYYFVVAKPRKLVLIPNSVVPSFKEFPDSFLPFLPIPVMISATVMQTSITKQSCNAIFSFQLTQKRDLAQFLGRVKGYDVLPGNQIINLQLQFFCT